MLEDILDQIDDFEEVIIDTLDDDGYDIKLLKEQSIDDYESSVDIDVVNEVDEFDMDYIDTINGTLSNISGEDDYNLDQDLPFVLPIIIQPTKSIDTTKPIKKVDLARAIYEDGIINGLARKDIIKLFEIDAGLTKAGAATYYANFHSKR
jgi:hypothetical protein